MVREQLTDEQWARLEPLLPPQKPRTGRPAHDHRRIIEAILWLDRTGAPWRDLPPEVGRWQTVSSRSTAGASRASGPGCSRRSKRRLTRGGTWTGWSTISIAP